MATNISRMNSLFRIRKLLGVTQAELALHLGVSQGNVSFYERGQTVPPAIAKKLIDYAATLGHAVTFDDVYAQPAESRPPFSNGAEATAAQAGEPAFENTAGAA